MPIVLRHQFLILKRLRVHYPVERIPEDVRVVAVVIAPLQFLDIAIHVLDAHLVESAHEGALEEAPDAFDAVRVNVADDPFFFGVVHGFMARVVVGDPDIGLEFVRVDGLGLILHVALDEVVERPTLDIGDAFDANLAAALDGARDPRLVALAPHLAAYERFIDLDHAEERRAFKGFVAHRLADAVAEIPRRFVGNAKRPLHLVGGDALLGFAHEVDGNKPLAQGKVGIVHDRPCGNAELIAA